MSTKAMYWAFKQRGINASEYRVLMFLAETHNEQTGFSFWGKAKIADECEMSESTVKNVLRSLLQKRLLKIERRKNGDRNLPNRYWLQLDQGDLFSGVNSDRGKNKPTSKEQKNVGQNLTGGGSKSGPEPKTLNQKEEPLENSATGVAPPAQGYKSKKGKTLSGKCLDQFEYFWNVFHHNWEKRGKAPAADQWYALCRNQEIPPRLWQQIIGAATSEARRRPQLLEKGLTPIMAEGWLSARRWEDEEFQPAQQANPHAGEAPWYSRLDTVQEKAGDLGIQVRDYDTHVELFDALIEKLRQMGDEVPAALVDYRNQLEKAVA